MENEDTYLSGNKSLTLQLNLETSDDRLSPIIDLDRVGVIAVSNRLNNPVTDYHNDPRVNKLLDDPNASIYISNRINLDKPADSLKVIFEGYRHNSNEFHLAYRLFRSDVPDDYQIYELFEGYDGNYNGLSDKNVPPSSNKDDYKTYEYTLNSSTTFNGVQIKLIKSGTDQANAPKIKNLRIIATL